MEVSFFFFFCFFFHPKKIASSKPVCAEESIAKCATTAQAACAGVCALRNRGGFGRRRAAQGTGRLLTGQGRGRVCHRHTAVGPGLERLLQWPHVHHLVQACLHALALLQQRAAERRGIRTAGRGGGAASAPRKPMHRVSHAAPAARATCVAAPRQTEACPRSVLEATRQVDETELAARRLERERESWPLACEWSLGSWQVRDTLADSL